MADITHDEQAATLHRQNQIRSELLLRALYRHHGDVYTEAPVEPEPVEEPVEEPAAEPVLSSAEIDFAEAWALLAKLPCANKVRRIQKIVANDFKVSVVDLTSSRRTADIVLPRQVAMYVAKTATSSSLPDIGRRFGGRDHTTVLHAVRKVARLIRSDASLGARVFGIVDRFEQSEVAT